MKMTGKLIRSRWRWGNYRTKTRRMNHCEINAIRWGHIDKIQIAIGGCVRGPIPLPSERISPPRGDRDPGSGAIFHRNVEEGMKLPDFCDCDSETILKSDQKTFNPWPDKYWK